MGYRLTSDASAPFFWVVGSASRTTDGAISLPIRGDDPLSFDVVIHSVDLAGNVSPVGATAHVSDPGHAGGCGIVRRTREPRSSGTLILAALLAGTWLTRPRRRALPQVHPRRSHSLSSYGEDVRR
jgi:hypothetical protein